MEFTCFDYVFTCFDCRFRHSCTFRMLYRLLHVITVYVWCLLLMSSSVLCLRMALVRPGLWQYDLARNTIQIRFVWLSFNVLTWSLQCTGNQNHSIHWTIVIPVSTVALLSGLIQTCLNFSFKYYDSKKISFKFSKCFNFPCVFSGLHQISHVFPLLFFSVFHLRPRHFSRLWWSQRVPIRAKPRGSWPKVGMKFPWFFGECHN